MAARPGAGLGPRTGTDRRGRRVEAILSTRDPSAIRTSRYWLCGCDWVLPVCLALIVVVLALAIYAMTHAWRSGREGWWVLILFAPATALIYLGLFLIIRSEPMPQRR